MKRFSVLYILVSMQLVSCSKEEVTSRSYPRVSTNEVSEINSDGVFFQGEIFYSSEKITDHGFLWTNSGWGGFAELGKAEKISLGATNNLGPFESRAEWNLEKGKTYIVRSYVQSEKYIVYGNIKEFISQGCKYKPIITDFNPKEGTIGETITIQGDFFSSISQGNEVMLGTQKALMVQSDKDKLIIKIPTSVVTGSVSLTVVSYGNQIVASQKFNIK